MIEDSHLPYFITEKLYILDESRPDTEKVSDEKLAKTSEVDSDSQTLKTEAPTLPNEVKEPIPSISKPKAVEKAAVPLAIWAPPLTTEDETLVKNILKAINQDFEKAKIMTGIAAYEGNYEKLICFGYQKELELKIGKSVPFYELTEHDGNSILVSAAPETLHQDTNQKKQLWGTLQQMFPKT